MMLMKTGLMNSSTMSTKLLASCFSRICGGFWGFFTGGFGRAGLWGLEEPPKRSCRMFPTPMGELPPEEEEEEDGVGGAAGARVGGGRGFEAAGAVGGAWISVGVTSVITVIIISGCIVS